MNSKLIDKIWTAILYFISAMVVFFIINTSRIYINKKA